MVSNHRIYLLRFYVNKLQVQYDMLSKSFNRLTGFADVEQRGKVIIISGISASTLSRDMKYIWNTSKIAGSMFIKATWSEIRIPSFFALEFQYILRKLVNSRGLYTSKRVLNNVIDALETQTWIANISVPQQPWLDRSKLKEIIYPKLLPHQAEFLDIYESTRKRYGLNGMLLAAAPGAGKAQPLYSKIHTPTGWKRMGDITIGDVVSTPDGGVGAVMGVFPQGVKDIYEITFADGRKARGCGEHLWAFIDGHSKPRNKPAEIKTTLEIKDRLETAGTRNHFIPLTKPVDSNPTLLPLDPYLLGMLLGDGGLRTQVIFTSPDEELVKALESAMPADCRIRQSNSCKMDYYIHGTVHGSNPMLDHLRDLGLHGKYSHEKSIPDIYMNSSMSQRLSLLQGLMDTDGTVDHHSTLSYTSTSKALAEQVQYLVRSLGGIAKITTKTPTYTHKDEKRVGRLAYTVNIRYPKPSELFRLTRKRERCNDVGQYTGDVLKLGIKSIEYIGEEEAQCIMIDHPDHLYITDDFVVTHNTVSGCSIALTTNATKVIIISPMNAIHKVWQKTLNTEFHIPQHPYVYKDSPTQFQPQKKWHIFHYEALDKAVELVKLYRNEKVCIIIDECHNFNEIKSMRTQRLLDLGSISGSNDILWMSGTPVKALGFETIPLLKSIDPLFDDPTENAFRKMFGKDAKRTLDILAHRLGLISHTVPKSEFMEEKPIYETIKVKMPNADKYTLPELSKVMAAFIEQRAEYYKTNKAEYQAIYDKCIDIHRATLHTPTQVAAFKEYQNAVQHLVRNGFDNKRDAELAVLTNKYEKNVIHPSLPQELRKPFANAKSVIKYVELKVRGECLGRILTKERIQCHVDMLAHIDFKSLINGVEKKTLIFTNYVAVVDECTSILKEQGFKPLAVHAETNSDLNSIVSRFDKDPSINPLVATYDSLSTAVPLTMANGVIFLNNPWRSYIKDQAIARAWRVGQNKQVYGFDVILDTGSVPNISSRSLDIMQWSKDQVDRIMGMSGGTDVSVEQYVGFAIPQVVDANEWVEDVLYDPEQQVPNVVSSATPEVHEKAYRPPQYQFYSQVDHVTMEALDESTTIPLNSLEAGNNPDKCELPPDWKPTNPTTKTK